MLTCVYQPPVSLVSATPHTKKNCLIRVNREVDTRKVMVSKFTEDKSGRVKVETNSTNKTLNQILRTRHKSGSNSSSSSTCSNSSSRKSRNSSSNNSLNSWNNNDEFSWESAYSSDSEPVRQQTTAASPLGTWLCSFTGNPGFKLNHEFISTNWRDFTNCNCYLANFEHFHFSFYPFS